LPPPMPTRTAIAVGRRGGLPESPPCLRATYLDNLAANAVHRQRASDGVKGPHGSTKRHASRLFRWLSGTRSPHMAQPRCREAGTAADSRGSGLARFLFPFRLDDRRNVDPKRKERRWRISTKLPGSLSATSSTIGPETQPDQ